MPIRKENNCHQSWKAKQNSSVTKGTLEQSEKKIKTKISLRNLIKFFTDCAQGHDALIPNTTSQN